jgi:succinate dehydrogenase / fumarate reductase cytochrome b subunit
MCSQCSFLKSTVGRKVLMALTGLVLVLFVLGHMLGNLQIFLGPDVINAYAYKLHHTMPVAMLWGIRLFLLACIGLHIWAAISLTLDNRKARPQGYADNKSVQATYAAKTMRMSGVILFAFIVFHIAHYTARNVPGMEYGEQIADVPLVKQGEPVMENGEVVMTFNVNDMMVAGFQVWWVSAFYIIATGLLCMHLTHGVSSMFQTVGLRNQLWRQRLDRFARVYGWVVFLGFAVIPVATLAGVLKQTADAPAVEAVEAAVQPLHK